MSNETERPFVAREEEIAAVAEHLIACRDGQGSALLVSGRFGGGKRALIGEALRSVDTEGALLLNLAIREQEDGLATVRRLYGSLVATLHQQPLLRGRVEMVLNAQMPQHAAREQRWLRSFIETTKRVPKAGEKEVQFQLPSDNPLTALTHLLSAIADKMLVAVALQNVHNCYNVAIWAWIESLLEAAKGRSLALVFSSDEVEEAHHISLPGPLVELVTREPAVLRRLDIAPWGASEVEAFLSTRQLKGNAARIAEIGTGLPGLIAEIVEVLNQGERLEETLDGVDLSTLTPTAVTGELDDEPAEEEEGAEEARRPKATKGDAERVHHLAALFGYEFPSGFVADVAGLERESVDDLLDACPELYEEVSFSEPLKTWVYRFKRPLYRHGVLSTNEGDEAKQRAVQVGTFLHTVFGQRRYDFVVKALRTFAEAGDERRAAMLHSVAMTSDRPELWAWSHGLTRYYDEIAWSPRMLRTVYMNLMERLVQLGQAEPVERLYAEIEAWATEHDDRALQAWNLFAGSRMDYRRQELYRARERATDALTLFGALDDKVKAAELNGHMAMIEIADGNLDGALERVETAESTLDAVPVKAHAAHVRGLVARQRGENESAIARFQEANALASQANLASVALESGLLLGETLLVSGKTKQGAETLTRCAQIANQVGAKIQERRACSGLAQSLGLLQALPQGLQAAQRALQISRELKFKHFVGPDAFNVGYFLLRTGEVQTALGFFEEAAQYASAAPPIFQKELRFHYGMALIQNGDPESGQMQLEMAIQPAEAAGDPRRLVDIRAQLGELAMKASDLDAAKAHFTRALEAAERGKLVDEGKSLKKRLDAISA